jgi:hypothetical protein
MTNLLIEDVGHSIQQNGRLEPRKEQTLILCRDLYDNDPDGFITTMFEIANRNTQGKLSHLIEDYAANEANDLIATLKSLLELGAGDDVTKALKNVVLGQIMKNTGVKPQPYLGNGGAAKIAPGVNKSPVKFNGTVVKRSPTKSFNDVVDAPTKAFNRVVADSLNLSPKAKSILKEAIGRKAAVGRLVNPTRAASTIDIPANRQPNQEKNAVTKFTDDEDTLEGTWSSHMKKEAVEANGRMKSDTAAGKTIEIPVVRMASFDTRNSLPPEFRNPKEIPNVVGVTLTDLPQPNTVKGGAAATYRKFPQSQPQQFPKTNITQPDIEAGPNV